LSSASADSVTTQEAVPYTPSLFERIRVVASLKNLRVLYRLPYFSKPVHACPVCGARDRKHEAANRYFAIDRCTDCGHCFARRMPGRRILRLQYSDFVYWHMDKHHQGIQNMAYGPEWQGFLDARMQILRHSELLNENGPPQKIFEIGCSEGILLHELSRMGHETLGSEMNTAIAEEGKRQLGVNILTEPFEDLSLPLNNFDLVMSFHTLEHMCDPRAVFERIRRIVKPDGGVVIEVPTGPEEYANTDHLQFFERNSLRDLIDQFFDESEILQNEYTNVDGVRIASLYGIGRRPRPVH
jgi:SAM-dependent methyltransferase